MTSFHVNRAAAVRKHGQHSFVVNFDPERAKYVSRLGDNLLDKLVRQKSDCWSHGNILSIVTITDLTFPILNA